MKKIGDTYIDGKVPEGTKIKFLNEKQAYIVRASNVAFSICTKPMNAKKTVLYTVVDWMQNIRGAENLIFGLGAETDEQCKNMLARLTEGETEISHRNVVNLDKRFGIEKLTLPPSKPSPLSRGAKRSKKA